MGSEISIRPYVSGDEAGLSAMIAYTLKVSNQKDYSLEYIGRIIADYSPESIAEMAGTTHLYVVRDGQRIIGCGGITGYRGSTTESYLQSVFVLPEYQGQGLGKRIMDALEADEYFERAWRTELAASITAVGFYRQLGYTFINGISVPDEYGVIRMEKRRQP